MLPSELKNKRILISPLNWGMGHVSRCIPLIDLMLKNDNVVFIAADDTQQAIFRQYFPEVNFIDHKGYPFRFGERGNFSLDLAKQIRPLQARLKDELSETEELVNEHAIDIVISDHRYGFLSSHAYSILLTHQLNLPVRWYEGWVQRLHHRLIGKFDEIWVPDTQNSDYAGELSKNRKGFNVKYIGHLSRFAIYEKQQKGTETVAIASGPDVYAVPFVKELLESPHEGLTIIARSEVVGLFSNQPELISSSDWKIADQKILTAGKIASRSGYSTLMDLIELKTPFSITPTPGQREQEYLFSWWYKKSLSNS